MKDLADRGTRQDIEARLLAVTDEMDYAVIRIDKGTDHGVELAADGYLKSADGEFLCPCSVVRVNENGKEAVVQTHVRIDPREIGPGSVVVSPSHMPEPPKPQKDVNARIIDVSIVRGDIDDATDTRKEWVKIVVPMGKRGGRKWLGVSGKIVGLACRFEIIEASRHSVVGLVKDRTIGEIYRDPGHVILNPHS